MSHIRLNLTKRLAPSPGGSQPGAAHVDAECCELRAQVVRRFNRWADFELSRGHHGIAERLSRRAEELRIGLLGNVL